MISGADRQFASNILSNFVKSGEISVVETRHFLQRAIFGDITSEQVSAFLALVAVNGVTREVRSEITRCYLGDHGANLSSSTFAFDKHSTGGVGDKMSLIVCPLAAAAGVNVTKLSGTSLLHCKGTIDKLSAFDGFRHVDDIEELRKETAKFGFSIGKAGPTLCAGDNLTYRLRNDCGSAAVPDLIAASIMSKKMVLNPKGLVLDVKVGPGGLFQSRQLAFDTAQAMLEIAQDHKIPTVLHLTRMENPLGRSIGGRIEVNEALSFLKGEHITCDLHELAVNLVASLLVIDRKIALSEAKIITENIWRSGLAYELFVTWLDARGINREQCKVENPSEVKFEVSADVSGWVAAVDARALGELNAGLHVEQDGNVGDIYLHKTVGDKVNVGDILVSIDSNTLCEEKLTNIIRCIYSISPDEPVLEPIVIDTLLNF